MSTAAKNARYTSAPIQNQLIECAGKVISNKLVEEINESGVFAILADYYYFFIIMHFCPGTMATHAESINSDLQRGLNRRLRHTQD